MITITPLDRAIFQYIRIRRDRGVSFPQIKREIQLFLDGVRDHRLPDDAIVLIEAE